MNENKSIAEKLLKEYEGRRDGTINAADLEALVRELRKEGA